ncbi:MAG: 4-diphosphocytidyl-2-C-methyl-D-erythritolkinase, partial [Pseudomonadota bacterium]
MSGSVAVAAAAKINLCLHVTGRRADGYHTIDSLMAFVGLADRLVAEAAPDGQLTLAVEGPFGRLLGPTGEDNIVLRAARALARAAGSAAGAKLTLGKFIPVAAGLGGGSADAAATLNALARLWGVPGSLDLRPIALALGADVPVCLAARPAHVTGIGENLGPVAALPDCGVLLVNPRIGLETRAVFAAFDAAGAGGSAA